MALHRKSKLPEGMPAWDYIAANGNVSSDTTSSLRLVFLFPLGKGA